MKRSVNPSSKDNKRMSPNSKPMPVNQSVAATTRQICTDDKAKGGNKESY